MVPAPREPDEAPRGPRGRIGASLRRAPIRRRPRGHRPAGGCRRHLPQHVGHRPRRGARSGDVDRWLRWQPWLGTFGALGALDAAPAHVGVVSSSPDRGLALWLDSSNTSEPRFTALRFDVRGEYSPLGGPLLVSDAGDLSPDHLVTSGAVTFDPMLHGGALTLEPGASAFLTDRTYAAVRVELDAPTGAPALLVLRDPLGHELEVGGVSCSGAIVSGSPLTLVVERRGTNLEWTVSSDTPSKACANPFTADARLSIGVRGAPDLSRGVVRNLRVSRLGSP